MLARLSSSVVLSAVAVALLLPASASAALFMRIATIQGGSMDPRHLGWIELWSFKRSRDEIDVTKALDKSSVDLEAAYAGHSRLGSALFDETCPNGASHMTITLIDPVVARFSTDSGGGEGPLDVLALKYRTISVNYGKPCAGPVPSAPKATPPHNH
jgi:type VI protein secretion system component Hcp